MTTVPAVRAALKSVLEVALDAWNVQVVDGSPVAVTTLSPNVLLIGAVEGVRSAGSQNRIRTTTRNIPFGSAQDEYTIVLVLSVSTAGPGELTDVLQTGDDIFEAARQAIQDINEALITGLFELLPTGSYDYDPEADSNGRYVTLTFGVDVTARD